MMMAARPLVTLHVVRHGETTANRSRIIQGQSDYPLTEAGREQARLVALRLAQVEYDAAFSRWVVAVAAGGSVDGFAAHSPRCCCVCVRLEQ